ncbi:unnamed protein product [Oncorhynchus mykiss]|uniref:PH domain-containing protein n=1 Tax=Oncorhynchus mykiss TaxID=8022 RepID=A0A060YGQ3_ONCMY|nr:unnamed protein product [Oncorhynchus mykiss]
MNEKRTVMKSNLALLFGCIPVVCIRVCFGCIKTPVMYSCACLQIRYTSVTRFLNVLMNCQWQSLLCQVQGGVLKMFRDEGCEECPQYTVQLKGCQVRPGPDTPQAYRITVVQHGDQVAVLEASCADEKEQWLQLLQDGSVSQDQADSLYDSKSAGALSGLKEQRFPTSNMYIDDPFHQHSGSGRSQPIYSNTAILEHMFQDSHNVARGDSVSSKDSVNYSNTDIFNNHSKSDSMFTPSGVPL